MLLSPIAGYELLPRTWVDSPANIATEGEYLASSTQIVHSAPLTNGMVGHAFRCGVFGFSFSS